VITAALSLAASFLLFLAIWVVVPAPTLGLLPFGVAVPELGFVLVVPALLVAVVAGFRGPGTGNRIALAGSLAACVLLAWPLVRLPMAARSFDAAFARARIEAPSGQVMRQRRFSPMDAFGLTGVGESRVERGVRARSMAMDIYSPASPGSYPSIVQIYGGAWQRGAPGDDEPFARYLASRGYVVFAIDYRHAPESRWPAQIDDVRDAVIWVRENASRFGADSERLALVGRSAGAQLALVAAYRDLKGTVDGVISYYGPVDLAEGWRVPPVPDPLDVRPVLEAYLGGTPDSHRDRYREASPITHASASAPPTLLLYGTRDHIVEARFGRALHDRLVAAGATSVLLEIPWSEHAFDVLPGGLGGQLSIYYVERFLARALRGKMEP
jgi:acetyl esterase/lipase